MDRRKFTKITLAATGAISMPGFITGCNNWPDNSLGGDENLFLNEEDFKRIRRAVDQNEWTEKRFEVLKKNVFLSEDEYYNSHWKQNWRQWTTGQYMKEIALYYRLTGDEFKLDEIKDLLVQEFNLDKIDKPYYNTKKEVSSSLWSWGMIHVNYLWAWDMVKHHQTMEAIKESMHRRLTEMVFQYRRYEDTKIRRLGNTQFWAITYMGLVGLLSGNEEAIEHSLSGKYGFKTVLETKIRDKKFWPEPLAYAYDYVICCMLLLAEASRVNGYDDLYLYESPGGASLKGMVDGLLELSFPNGLLVPCGDGALGAEIAESGELIKYKGTYLYNSPFSRFTNKFELLYKAYKDPKYAWLIQQEQERLCYDVTVWGDNTLTYGIPIEETEVPTFKDRVYPEIGHALISTENSKHYWKGDNVTLHVRNGCSIQYHGHNDQFNIGLFAYGKLIYPDWFRRWEYLAPRASRNNRNKTPFSHYTLGHNTVVVDKQNPDYPRHQLVTTKAEINDIFFSEVKSSGSLKYISLEGSVYKGVNQKRTLCITPDYLLDIFECSSDDIHTYDYVLHDEGHFEFDTKLYMKEYNGFTEDYKLQPIDSESKSEGNSWLRKGKKGAIDKSWQGGFRDEEERRVNIYVEGEKGTEIFVSNTPIYAENGWDNVPDDIKQMSKPLLIIRRKCRTTKFIVLHQLANLDNKYKLELKNNDIEIIADDYNDLIEIRGEDILLTSKHLKTPS